MSFKLKLAWETSLPAVGSGETKRFLRQYGLLSLPPRTEGKSLLLKTPCTWDTRAGGIELEMTWKPPSWGPPLIVSKVLSKAPRETNNQWSYPSLKTTKHNDQHSKTAQWCCNGALSLEVTISHLIKLKTLQLRRREFVPSSRNLANYLYLKRSQVQEEHQLLLFP